MISSWFILVTVVSFLAIIVYLSGEMQSIFDSAKSFKIYNVDEKSSQMRVIHIKNNFPKDISVFYEENDVQGSFLSILAPNETLQVSSISGNTLYATDPNGFERIANIYITSESDRYSFNSPEQLLEANRTLITEALHGSKALSNGGKQTNVDFELNVEHRTRSHPSVHRLERHELASTATAAKFRSLSGEKIDLWYDDGDEGIMQAHLSPGQETTTNTYEGHVFFATYRENRNVEIARFHITKDQVLYIIDDKEHPAPLDIIQQSRKEEAFMADYYNRTGIHWRHYFGPEGPRPPPVLNMWPGKRVGDVHKVYSTAGYWTCDAANHCGASPNPVSFELEVISVTPRAFIIKDFINEAEINEIQRISRPHLHLSQVGDASSGIFESNTRTSLNTWVPRRSSSIIENLYLRAAQVLRIPAPTLYRNAEDIQVVHYERGQKYDAHHDWGVTGRPESRFLTLLMYLNDPVHPTAGGYTSFPKDGNGGGIKVHPGKGNAVLFYDLLEDGNGDDLALHAAMPVTEGEKWLANFWVWDPIKE